MRTSREQASSLQSGRRFPDHRPFLSQIMVFVHDAKGRKDAPQPAENEHADLMARMLIPFL
jgi:hypothetical protein